VQAIGRIARSLPKRSASETRPAGARPSNRRARIRVDGRGTDVSIHERDSLGEGRTIRGPAVVTEYSSTVWIPPGSRASVDSSGILVIRIDRR
jgi:N-methylhydantoinase A